MNQPWKSYSDEQLWRILQADDGQDNQASANHFAECPHCQARLERIVGEPDQWRDIRDSLQGDDERNDEGDVARSSALEKQTPETRYWRRGRWKSPNAWTESMAKSLLSAASHREILGRIGRYDVERLIGRGRDL